MLFNGTQSSSVPGDAGLPSYMACLFWYEAVKQGRLPLLLLDRRVQSKQADVVVLLVQAVVLVVVGCKSCWFGCGCLLGGAES